MIKDKEEIRVVAITVEDLLESWFQFMVAFAP